MVSDQTHDPTTLPPGKKTIEYEAGFAPPCMGNRIPDRQTCNLVTISTIFLGKINMVTLRTGSP